jgi:hypothetical protein
MKALARLIGPMPSQDHPIELQNLLLEAEQLGTERGKARAGNLWHSPVVRVGNNVQQFRDSFTPDRRDNAKLGKVRPDRINHRSLLANEQMTSAVKHQAALLLRRLGWHEPHVGSGDRLANRLSVSHVVLLPFDVGLHISRRHQSHGMAEYLQLARPMVGRGTGLDTNQAWRQLLEERQHVTTLQLAADDHLTGGINSVDLENRLGDIKTDCRDRLHGSLL